MSEARSEHEWTEDGERYRLEFQLGKWVLWKWAPEFDTFVALSIGGPMNLFARVLGLVPPGGEEEK